MRESERECERERKAGKENEVRKREGGERGNSEKKKEIERERERGKENKRQSASKERNT